MTALIVDSPEHRVVAEKDRYYVYMLLDERGWPFYIGKGLNRRINDHFKAHLLSKKSHKNHKIKDIINKQGFVKREILSYFDDEEGAYALEESLISAYGLRNNGGLLTNTLVSWKDYDCKGLAKGRAASVRKQLKFTEAVALTALEMRRSDPTITFKKMSLTLGISETRLSDFFLGKIKSLAHIETGYVRHPKFRGSEETIAKIVEMRSTHSVVSLMSIFSISKTHIHRLLNQHKQTAGAGTSSEPNGEDTSSNNLENNA